MMKIMKIKVANFRGLVDFSFEPDAKSTVIFGPNGSGKSALVDAIEFLFSGKITRLEGRGTGELKLKKHGAHIDHKPKDAIVESVVSVDGTKDYTLMRTLDNPSNLQCDPPPDDAMKDILAIAARGYHVLSRREILTFIAAEPSTRAQEVQSLLNLDRVESLRKTLEKLANETDKLAKSQESNLTSLKTNTSSVFDLTGFDVGILLSQVNTKRKELEADPIAEADLSEPKKAVLAPKESKEASVNPALLEKEIAKISLEDESLKLLEKHEQNLQKTLAEVRSNPDLRKDLDHKKLLDQGVSLLGKADRCPLCGLKWKPEDLKRHLEERQKRAEEAGKKLDSISVDAGAILKQNQAFRIVISALSESATKLAHKKTIETLDGWDKTLLDWSAKLEDPLAKYPQTPPSSATSSLTPTGDLTQNLKDLHEEAKKTSPSVSPQLMAWDVLTKFEKAWSDMTKGKEESQKVQTKHKLASTLSTSFLKSRDSVLESLFDGIRDSFVHFYHILHDHEKSTFSASLKHEKAGLKMEVDFLGRGSFPPLALHSEGHQDSMGLCLYLALMKKLTSGKVGLTVLDDVVMSVDSGHRRSVCELLLSEFKDRQFFITTHDRMWARQLKNAGVVRRKNYLAFRNWTIEAGPTWHQENLWQEIAGEIEEGNVRAAAPKLRRELEQFFEEICDNFAAPVAYRGDASYELGDLAPSALGHFSKLLGKAKSSAQDWGQDDKFKQIKDWDDKFQQSKKATRADDWLINKAVHYNSWVDASKQDFEPIFKAFQELKESFSCPKCESLIYVTPRGRPESIRCDCNDINWNLKSKPKD